MTTLTELLESAQAVPWDFQAYYYRRSLELQAPFRSGTLDVNAAIAIPVGSALAVQQFAAQASGNILFVRRHFIDILLSEQSAKVLWCLYCSSCDGAHSILTKVIPSLEPLVRVVRGGPNLYKLNGWLVHVLVGYGMVTDYLRRGILPVTIDWPESVSHFVSQTACALYASLSDQHRAILHVAVLGHDIGVAVQIPEHDLHGVPLVPAYIREVGLDNETLRERFSVGLEDFEWAVMAIVRHHTFISRVGVELSVSRSAGEISTLVSSAESVHWRQIFLRTGFAPALLLLGVADLVAVDDALLTERKIGEMTRGFDTAAALLTGTFVSGGDAVGGIGRFCSLLSDRNSGATKTELESHLESLGCPPEQFWVKFYHIQELNFALSLVSHLSSATDTLLVFILLFCFIDAAVGTTTELYSSTRVTFDPSLSKDRLSSCLRAIDLVLFRRGLRDVVPGGEFSFGGLRFGLAQEDSTHFVWVKGAE